MQEKISGYCSTVVASHASESDAIPTAQLKSAIISPAGVPVPNRDDSRVKAGVHSGDTLNGGNRGCAAGVNGFHFAAHKTVETNGGAPAARKTPETNAGATPGGTNQFQRDGLESSDLDTLIATRTFPKPFFSRTAWNVRANPALTASVNPIRRITDALILDGTNGKALISLAQGDPAQFGPHMRVPDVANSALKNVVDEGRHNGYTLSSGLLECRRVVADYLSVSLHHKLTPQDVIITSGCTQAIQHSIDAVRFEGCNVLLPRPGFPLYETLCKYFGVEVRQYDLLEDRDWEVDLDHLAALADGNTAAIIVCNPGNPSGTVLAYQHLSQIATLAEALKVPIIADEVYARLVFGENPFVPMAKFSTLVPVISVGGLSKNWLAPGWRIGWLSVSDPHGILRKAKVVEAMTKLMQMTLGPSTLMQAAVPQLLQSTPPRFFQQTCSSLKSGSELCYTRINKIHGLDCPTRPQGSMFMMVRLSPAFFKTIKTDVAFSAALLKEESVLVLPGTAFGLTNWVRIVFALSLSQLNEALDRIEEFCSRHAI